MELKKNKILNYLLEYALTVDNWNSLSPEKRIVLLTEEYCRMKNLIRESLRNFKMGEKRLLKMLGTITGYNDMELKQFIIKKGDIGSVAEFVLNNNKQNIVVV